jgi:hypothetical protein
MPELPLVGTDFAGYHLRAVLGRGGMSIVYQAENPRATSKNITIPNTNEPLSTLRG